MRGLPNASARLGSAVDISGDWAVVGAPAEGTNGAAHIYRRDDAGTPEVPEDDGWTLEQTLIGDRVDAEFGASVAIDNDLLVVGSPGNDTFGVNQVGLVSIYRLNGGVWNIEEHFSGVSVESRFGHDVDVDNETIIVSGGIASGNNIVQTFIPGDTRPWENESTFTVANRGWSVAIDGDTFLIGSNTGNSASGAQIFNRIGGTWTEGQVLTRGTWFGWDVDLDGDVAIVSDRIADANGTDSGAVYVYHRSGGTWSPAQELVEPPAEPFELFGFSAAIHGDTIVVGRTRDGGLSGGERGSVDIFQNNGSTWAYRRSITGSDIQTEDRLGTSIAFDGERIVAGAPYHDTDGDDSGAAYIFAQLANDFGDAPAPFPTLLADDGAAHERDPQGPVLGSVSDGEENGQPSAFADGDDNLATDDEDGITLVSSAIPGSQVDLEVEVSNAAGNLFAWADFNRDGDWLDPGEQIFDAQPVAIGTNQLSFALPLSVGPGALFTRFRISTEASLPPTGLAINGEVEDHQFTVDPSITDNNGVVTIIGDDTAEELTIRIDAATGNFEYSFDGVFFSQDLDSTMPGVQARTRSQIAEMNINLAGGDDVLIVDSSTGDPIPSTLNFEGGSHLTGDQITLTGGNSAPFHELADADSGEFRIQSGWLSYTGLELIVDEIETFSDRWFRFTDADDDITLADHGPADDEFIQMTSIGSSVPVVYRGGAIFELFEGSDRVTILPLDQLATREQDFRERDGNDIYVVDAIVDGQPPVGRFSFRDNGTTNNELRVVGRSGIQGTLSGRRSDYDSLSMTDGTGTQFISFPSAIATLEVSLLDQLAMHVADASSEQVTISPTAASGGEQASLMERQRGNSQLLNVIVFDVADLTIDLSADVDALAASDMVSFVGDELARGLTNLSLHMGTGFDDIDLGGAEVRLPGELYITGQDIGITLSGGLLEANFLQVPLGTSVEGFGEIAAPFVGFSYIEPSGGTLSLGDGPLPIFSFDGLAEVGGETLEIIATGPGDLGVLTTLGGGTIAAADGVALGAGDRLIGHGAISGAVLAGIGSLIQLNGGDLTLGDATALDGFFSDGRLAVGSHTATIEDRNIGVLGSLTTLAGGTLVSVNGLLLENSKALQGEGTVDSDFENQGFVEGPIAPEELLFNGDVDGAGSFAGNVVFANQFAPGNSPAQIEFADQATLLATSTLEIELGGLNPGVEYDRLNITDTAALAGTLDVTLIDGFVPEAGDAFEIIAAAGGIFGAFDLVNLPPLPVGFDWEIESSTTTYTLKVVSNSNIVGRHIFYRDSAFVGTAAIASDKSALLPGEPASFANYTSYVHGINGLWIDIADAPNPSEIGLEDFSFRTGTTNDTSAWDPLSVSPSVSIAPGAGAGGSDRIELTWPNATITGTWLEVRLAANADTGLSADDVFYFGNQIGDTNGDGLANGSDFMAIQGQPRNFLDPAAVDDVFDLNRDQRVNAADMLIVRDHATLIGDILPMITPANSIQGKVAEIDIGLALAVAEAERSKPIRRIKHHWESEASFTERAEHANDRHLAYLNEFGAGAN